MIVSLLAVALQAAAPAPAQTGNPPPVPAQTGTSPLATLPRQSLPAKGCAVFLWTRSNDHRLVAMATAEPAQLRLALDGGPADYAIGTSSGAGGFGFAGTTAYQRGAVTATLDMTIQSRDDMIAGARVPEAALRLDRPGQDSLVIPLAGLVGCASQG